MHASHVTQRNRFNKFCNPNKITVQAQARHVNKFKTNKTKHNNLQCYNGLSMLLEDWSLNMNWVIVRNTNFNINDIQSKVHVCQVKNLWSFTISFIENSHGCYKNNTQDVHGTCIKLTHLSIKTLLHKSICPYLLNQ